MGFKELLQNRRLLSILSRPKPVFAPSDTLFRKVGFIVCLNSVEQLKLVDKLCRLFSEQGDSCSVCIYQRNKKLPVPHSWGDNDWLVLDYKHVNWYGLIRPEAADSFVKQSFDLLINLSPEYYFTTSYMAALTKARLKVGRYVRPQTPYHLVLGIEQAVDGDDFVRLLEDSLKCVKLP
ncbi:MAG: hypothetical protein FWE30_04140 [Bacteroidales bacterium]|nr:hypothetical protein [Bacteroidales bacterium]MCL2738618.1 hypothetical protein [Bacteroidales bacterium]